MMNGTFRGYFLLNGFDELGSLRPLLFLPYAVLLLVALLANGALLYVVSSRPSLHSPMYVLMAGMAGVNLLVPLFFVPHMLLSFLLDWRGISLTGCLLQMHLIHFVGSFQCTFLLWMAVDRYYAICRPLRYLQLMALPRFLWFLLPLAMKNLLMITQFVVLASRLTFCSHLIPHCFCEHMAVVALACGSTAANSLAGLMALLFIAVFDFVFIVLSYVVIFCSVLRSGKSKDKAVHTCVTHMLVLVVSLSVTLVALLSYRVGSSLPPSCLVFFSTMYLLIPSCISPLLYGVRTPEIQTQLLSIIKRPLTSDPSL